MNEFLQRYRMHIALTVVLLSLIVFFGVRLLPTFVASSMPKLGAPKLKACTTICYVSPTGLDSNPGTQTLPWKTIKKATLSAKRTVYVLAGDYPERVTIKRAGLSFLAQGEVTLRGFVITGNRTVISGFHILNSGAEGIILQSSKNIVRNNKVEHATLVGIEIEQNNNLVEGNEIWGTTQDATSDADGIRFFGSGHVIRSNYIHDIHYGIPQNKNPHIDCFQTWNDSSKGIASNIVIERNICINPDAQASAEAGQGFMLEGAKTNHIIIRNNVVRAYHGVNAIGISDLTVVNNTFIGDISNSSVYRLINSPLAFYSGGNTNVVFQNNILVDFNANIIVTGNSITGGHNLVYRTDGSKPATDSAYSNSTDLWGVNPMFINYSAGDYHLGSGSPAIDAGLTLSIVTNDLDGNPRPQGAASDIGAFETTNH